MTQKILVAYATKHGATAEIAQALGQAVAEALRQHDRLVVTQPIDQVSDLTGYGAVVLGSAVYMGQWRKEAAQFLKANEEALAARDVWLFSSGPTGEGDPSALMDDWHFPEGLQPLADRIGPHDIAFFHGVLDMEKLSFAERLLVKGIKAPVGDFRDWTSIRAWATEIADTVRGGE
jgi:menaquinone-dependent protoporphyrinogen oxidase